MEGLGVLVSQPFAGFLELPLSLSCYKQLFSAGFSVLGWELRHGISLFLILFVYNDTSGTHEGQ